MQFLINAKPRRGAMIPLFAILLIPLLAMLAFSIDAGWMVLTRTDLQNTADAAALAGAEKLQEMWVQYYSPGQVSQSTILTQAVTNSGPGSPMATAEKYRAVLADWYGQDAATKVKHAEAFEICEYGRQPDKAELKKLFPFFD